MRKLLYLSSSFEFQYTQLPFHPKVASNTLLLVADNDLPSSFAEFYFSQFESGDFVFMFKMNIVVRCENYN